MARTYSSGEEDRTKLRSIKMTPGEYIGALGVFILLFAFALNLAGHLNANAPTYHALNAIGAGLACYASCVINFIPFVVLEGTWFVVASSALVWQLTKTRSEQSETIN